MHHITDENIRNWVYIVSIGLFLRQYEAANLLLSNVTPATDPTTGEPIMTGEGLPHCLVVTITRDKTNKDGPGGILVSSYFYHSITHEVLFVSLQPCNIFYNTF